jgi:hypothetical protein
MQLLLPHASALPHLVHHGRQSYSPSIAIITTSITHLQEQYNTEQNTLNNSDADARANLPTPHCAAPATPPEKVLADSLKYIHDITTAPTTAPTVPEPPTPPPQRLLLHPIYRLRAFTEYYSATGHDTADYWPPDWYTNPRLLESHLRSATAHNLAANSTTLWSLQVRQRDPLTRYAQPMALHNDEFQIAARLFLGIGLDGLVKLTPQAQCHHAHCKKPVDRAGIHLLHRCHLLQPLRTHRHNRLQSICKDLLRNTDLQVSEYTPNVTANPNSNTQAFADIKVHDRRTGSSVVIDFTIASVHTQESYNRSPGVTKLPQGPPTAYHIANHRRVQKIKTKQPGCGNTPFLPFVTTAVGAFIPQDLHASELFNSQAQRVFQAPLTNKSFGGRVGTRPRSPEEALLRKWSRRAADRTTNGTGIFDATLTPSSAGALIVSHYYKRIHHELVSTTAQGVINAIGRNDLQLHLSPTATPLN